MNAQTDLPYNVLGAMSAAMPVHRRDPAFHPCFLVDGARGLRMAWPAALVGGVSFGLVQYLVSNFLAVQITDVLAALASAGAIVALSRVWRPAEVLAVPSAGSGPAASRREMLLAYAPYIFIVIIFSLAQVPPIAHLLGYGVYKFPWPGLALTQADGSKINTTSRSTTSPSLERCCCSPAS